MWIPGELLRMLPDRKMSFFSAVCILLLLTLVNWCMYMCGDVRWSEKLPSSDTPIGLPPCPHCKTNVSVGAHGFHDQHFGRCIIGLTDWYLSITRRYICHSCSKVAQEVRSGDEATAAPAYTWMGWDERSLDLMPFGLGSQYPALLTHRNGIDMMVCSLMRPLFHKGLRPAGFTKMLEELHAKEHSR